MMYRVWLFAAFTFCCLVPASAIAAGLPPIRTSEGNAVPECATPGRMMAFLRARNEELDPRFEKIAVHYMRYGEELGLRWDYAFIQMAIETGYLTFKRSDNKNGLVRPEQNNFAGLGAVGKGERGESFKDVGTGVLAHLQHVLLYSGEPVKDPVAERTRKVAEWGILKPWQSKIQGPITYAQLARRWAASGGYVEAIEAHADRFYSQFCTKPDPNPEFVLEARGGEKAKRSIETAAVPAEKARPAVSGAELARQAIEDGKAAGNNTRSSLGAGFLARAGDEAAQSLGLKPDRPEKPAPQTAAAAGAVAKPETPAAPACRVWTASYGGQKAILIRVQNAGSINYTVLDVNEGAETREANAYMAAYARGGTIAGEFPSSAQALDKAFELCPEN